MFTGCVADMSGAGGAGVAGGRETAGTGRGLSAGAGCMATEDCESGVGAGAGPRLLNHEKTKPATTMATRIPTAVKDFCKTVI